MRYTRYNLKKRNKINSKFIIIVVMVLITAFGAGTIIANIFIKNNNEVNKNISQSEIVKNKVTVQGVKYEAIQCGVLAKKENADELMNRISKLGGGFVLNEGGKYKVFYAICKDSENAKYIKLLTDNKIDILKVMFNVNKTNSCNSQIIEIVDADLKIFDMLSQDTVKAIQTTSLKQWVSKLPKEYDKSENLGVLNELKDYINGLPKELNKNNKQTNSLFIYNEIRKIK